jgi:hypothetical protein
VLSATAPFYNPKNRKYFSLQMLQNSDIIYTNEKIGVLFSDNEQAVKRIANFRFD